VLQAAITGSKPKQPYISVAATDAFGGGTLQPLAAFMSSPAGAAIFTAVGPIRQVVQADAGTARCCLVASAVTAVRHIRLSWLMGPSVKVAADGPYTTQDRGCFEPDEVTGAF